MAELALTVTILLVLMLAVFDLGRAFQSYLSVVHAAREGARLAMDCDLTSSQIESIAAGAAAPVAATVTVSRPACPDGPATVTATYEFEWVTPVAGLLWRSGQTMTMSSSMISR